MKKFIKNYTLDELSREMPEFGEPEYRAEQIFRHMYLQNLTDFGDFSSLPKELREKFSEKYELNTCTLQKVQTSALDGSQKFLFRLPDGNSIESVLIPEEDRLSLCMSSQVGCALGCRFCATGTLGLNRNLETGEIVDQFIRAEIASGKKITNIIFMGMGEPLQNYENVTRAIKILSGGKVAKLGRKRITISTVGVVPKIYQLADDGLNVKLALSLHATTNGERRHIIPIAKKWDLTELGDAIEYYYRKTKNSVTYEYIVFDNFNESAEDAKRLAKIARRVPSLVNLIPFNDISFAVEDLDYPKLDPAPKRKVIKFADMLKQQGANVFIRWSAGSDIDAACGQLALSERAENAV